MEAIVTALISVVGTLLVGALGFWQWKRSQSKEASADYVSKRKESLTAVWTAINNVEEEQRLGLRRRRNQLPLPDEHIREVNLLLMRHAPFLQIDEQEWTTSIVQKIIEIDTMVRHARQAGSDTSWWESTIIQPAESSLTSKAAFELSLFRGALGERYAEVMKGTHD